MALVSYIGNGWNISQISIKCKKSLNLIKLLKSWQFIIGLKTFGGLIKYFKQSHMIIYSPENSLGQQNPVKSKIQNFFFVTVLPTVYHQFSKNDPKNLKNFCPTALKVLIAHRAEILQIFRVIFWKIDEFVNQF